MTIRTIVAQETKADAHAPWDEVADTLRDNHGKLGALMDAGGEDVLTYLDYPKEPLGGLPTAANSPWKPSQAHRYSNP